MVESRLFMAKYGPLMDAMSKADEITKALKENAKAHRDSSTLRLSRMQMVAGIIVGGVAVADLLMALTR